MKTLLITGATGLVGSHMISYIESNDLTEGFEIVGMQRGRLPLMQFDYIIHAAGYGQPARFLENEIETIKVNTTMLMDLFNSLKPGGKLLYLSSSEVYSGSPPPQKETDMGRTTPAHQRACYIESKRCGEAICMAYRRMGYDVKIARLSLAYGATRKGDTRVLNHFIEQAITNKKIEVQDKGEAQRTYIYVEDAVNILWDILMKGTSDVYNVGGISQTSIAELALKIGELTGSTVTFGDSELVGAPTDVRLNINKVLEEFGQREFTSLNDGLKKTIQEYEKA